MSISNPLSIYLGFDTREAIAAHVARHSIYRRTQNASVKYLKHQELRDLKLFKRPWLTESNGVRKDLIDNKLFSTEFSHTRFLVPHLMKFKGWALFADSDMIFLSDLKKLFSLCDDKYAVMCVKHMHKTKSGETKMDGQQQISYFRKNWSSFVLFNCAHPSNRQLTPANVNFMDGSDLHSFSWLRDQEIGSLPTSYNYISGVSPKLPPESGGRPDVVHYTLGGPWFDECQDVPYSHLWLDEYEDYMRHGHDIGAVPTTKFDPTEDKR